MSSSHEIVRDLLSAFARGDLPGVRSHLAPGMRANITNADGDVDHISSAEAFMARVPDVDSVSAFEMLVTQVVETGENEVLAMVEIQAGRNDQRLHNFAAFLIRTSDGLVNEFWMVEALPAHSDEFWS